MQIYERALLVLHQNLGEEYQDTLERMQVVLPLFDDDTSGLEIAIRNQILMECVKRIPVEKVVSPKTMAYESAIVFEGHRMVLSTAVNGFHTVTKITYPDGNLGEIVTTFVSLSDGHRRAMLQVLLDTALSVKENCLRSTVKRKEIVDD